MIYLITNYQNYETKYVRIPLHPTPTPPHTNLWFHDIHIYVTEFQNPSGQTGHNKNCWPELGRHEPD